MLVLKKITTASCAVLMLFTIPACSATAENGEQHGAPVAKINGSVISKPELDRAVKALLAQKQGTQTLEPEQLQKATAQALDQLAGAELLYQAASRFAIKDLDQQVADRYAQNRAKFPSEAEYEKALQGLAMTPEQVRQAMRKEIVVNSFVEREFTAKGTVSQAEVRKFYDQNKGQYFNKGERRNASHILVSVDQKASAQEKKQAREKAEELLKKVLGGEDFAAVAKKDSDCPSSARGGVLGLFGKGEMAPSFEKAAFALKPGELSPVVETRFGYHIIKVTGELPPSTESFEEVKEKISAFLKREKVQQAFAAFMVELRAKARIEKI